MAKAKNTKEDEKSGFSCFVIILCFRSRLNMPYKILNICILKRMNHQSCNSITKPLHDSSMSKAPQKLKAPKNLAQKVMTTPVLIVMIALLLKGMTALVLKALLKARV